MDGNEVIFNKYHKDTKKLEYYMENKKGERIVWKVAADVVLKSMKTTKEHAEERQKK